MIEFEKFDGESASIAAVSRLSAQIMDKTVPTKHRGKKGGFPVRLESP
jgi:hypothetical protein